MKKLLLTSIAALLLATGAAHAETPLTEHQKAEVYRTVLDACTKRGIKDGKSTLPWVPIESVLDYCKCGAEGLAEIVSAEEYDLGIHPEKWPQFPNDSIAEKTQCVVFPKCKFFLNLRNSSQHHFERCWKG